MAVKKKIESKSNPHWEREALEKIALSALGEQKIARRWGIFFKSITFLYLFVLLFFAFGAQHTKSSSNNHTALIEINGVIGEKDEVNAEDFFESVQRAYDSDGTKGIILKTFSRAYKELMTVTVQKALF